METERTAGVGYDYETVVDRSGMESEKWLWMKAQNPSVRRGVVPFSVADMELCHPPELIEGLKGYLDNIVLGYTSPGKGYLDAVTGWMRRRHGWEVDPEWVVCTHGVVSAFSMAVAALTEPGDGVLLLPPVYGPMRSAIEQNGRAVAASPLLYRGGRYTMDFDDIARKARDPRVKLLLFCSPHNPVGRVWTREELLKLGRICIENGVVVLSDEIHFDFVLPGHRHTVFASLSEEFAQNTIVCTAPSKTFNLAGLQIANIIIPNAALRARYVGFLSRLGAGVTLNMLSYKACEIVYNQCEAWLEGALALVARNGAAVRQRLLDALPQVACVVPEGTYLQWMDFRGLGMDDAALERVLHHEAEVFFVPGGFFGAEGRGFMRMNVAAPAAVVDAGLDRLVHALA